MTAIQKKFKQGDIVFSEGSIGKNFYFIESGKKKVLSQLSSGETFGEYALIEEHKKTRSATLTVLEDSEIVVLDKTTLENTLKDIPAFVLSLLKSLIHKSLNLEDRYFRMQGQCQDFNFVHLIELLKEKQESLLHRFPAYLKKYTPEQRREILSYMERLVDFCREKYNLPAEKNTKSRADNCQK
ncbi:Crp/Fnr family transcriptional regulator [Gemmatimonadota bacterium]